MPPKQLSGTAVPFTLLTTADVPVKQEGAICLCVLISLFPPVEPSAGATRQVSPTQGGIADSSQHHQPKKTSANRKSQRSWFYYLHQKMADNTTHTSVSLCPVKVKTRFFKIYKCDFQPVLSCNPISHPTHHTTQAILAYVSALHPISSPPNSHAIPFPHTNRDHVFPLSFY